jgi:hypothetical protein
MRVLIACEYSGVVRDAFINAGHDAISCDLLPTEKPGPHYQGDVFDIVNDGFDLMIAHPPCTDLATSGAAWFAKKIADGRQAQAIDFFMKFVNCSIPKICIENPVGIMSSKYRKPDQIIQPYMFGDSASKKTCLWLKGIPLLYHNKHENLFNEPTTWVDRGEMVTFKSGRVMPKWYADAWRLPKHERQKLRSRTFQGIANAMALQWGTI